MAKIKYSSTTDPHCLSDLSAGDRLKLATGAYTSPLVLDSKLGTERAPIIVEPATKSDRGGVVFSSGMDEDEARLWANGVADRRQQAGYYPTFGHLGDQAMLVLRNCQYVVIQGLNFAGCWPGAIYLDNCQHIVIHDVLFESGTIAIGANGRFTHDIIVQHCRWEQDTSRCKMWNTVPWVRIHGAANNSDSPGVDLKGDYRHWDGDFFRAWDISGNVIIRNNTISDAFNGIHFFNSIDKLAPGVKADTLAFNNGRRSSANVLIENNDFLRVRDNVFEPEDHAWNWVIRHNRLLDCYRPFSFELERAGYFYVYGNTGSFMTRPSMNLSPEDKKYAGSKNLRQSVSLFKPKGRQANEGPLYVFNNSWYFKRGKGILPKFGLGKLFHLNNAIEVAKPKKGRLFGNDGHLETVRPLSLSQELESEQSRFTRRWADYQIQMNGDVANDSLFPETYRAYGYGIGLAAAQAKPGYKKPTGWLLDPPDYTSTSKSIVGKAVPLNLELPDGTSQHLPANLNVGAVQSRRAYGKIKTFFRFLPDDGWLPRLTRPRSGLHMGTIS